MIWKCNVGRFYTLKTRQIWYSHFYLKIKWDDYKELLHISMLFSGENIDGKIIIQRPRIFH